MNRDLTTGNVTKTMLFFAGPMIAGNLLQQFYNIADTLIVGKFLGAGMMAAVGAAYTLMTFLTSVLIGLCMGSGSVLSFYYGKKDMRKVKECMGAAFVLIGGVTVFINILVLLFLNQILGILQVPEELIRDMYAYMRIIAAGLVFIFLYNYFAYLLRAVGNSVVPLYFLGGTSVLNVALDLLFIIKFHWGIEGAAAATVISQAVSGVGIGIYTWRNIDFHIFSGEGRGSCSSVKESMAEIFRFSFASSAQQSVMNLGILAIQGLVNSFGVSVMAAFAAAVKIDSLAYMPAQEFGNAFSLFISQNNGAGEKERVRKGTRNAIGISMLFCICVSLLVIFAAKYLMRLFVSAGDTEIIDIGVGYLRTEGAFYWGIGILFLLYGYFRGISRPEISLVLTIFSLGTRVALAYILAPIDFIGIRGIWWAIPIGWLLADAAGILMMLRKKEKIVKK